MERLYQNNGISIGTRTGQSQGGRISRRIPRGAITIVKLVYNSPKNKMWGMYAQAEHISINHLLCPC